MKFALSQIKKESFKRPFTFDQLVDVSELEKMQNDIKEIKPVRVNGTCIIQAEQVICSFTISGEMILPCARTLVDVPYLFEFNTTEVFSMLDDLTDEDRFNEINQINGDVLDLMPLIMENIILETPFRVFSDEAQTAEDVYLSGKGWDFQAEQKREQKIDPRLQKLQSFFTNNREDK